MVDTLGDTYDSAPPGCICVGLHGDGPARGNRPDSGITGTGQLTASDAIAIPATSHVALLLGALLLAAVGARRVARRRVR